MKRLLIISLLLMSLVVSGCETLSEKICNGFDDGNLTDKHHCVIGDDNLTYQYSFVCGKNNIVCYSDKDVEEINLPLKIKIQCNYMKVRMK